MRMYQMDDVFFILNLENKKIEIYQHFSLILCYFWRQNCLKTWILAFWITLVNACWPHVCAMTKYILGACKYLSQIPSPQISRQEIQNSSRGVEKTIFLCLQAVDEITTFISGFSGFCARVCTRPANDSSRRRANDVYPQHNSLQRCQFFPFQ